MNNMHVRRASRVDWLSGAWSHACIKSDGKSEHNMLSFLLSHDCLCISSWNNVLILGNDAGERNPKKSSQRQPAKGHQQEKEYWQNLLTLANSTRLWIHYYYWKDFCRLSILNFSFSSFYLVHGEDLFMRFVGRHFRWYAKNVCCAWSSRWWWVLLFKLQTALFSNQSKCSNNGGDHVLKMCTINWRIVSRATRPVDSSFATAHLQDHQLMIDAIIFQSKSSDQKSAHRCEVKFPLASANVEIVYSNIFRESRYFSKKKSFTFKKQLDTIRMRQDLRNGMKEKSKKITSVRHLEM